MGREGEVVQQLMPEFERRHPGIRVRVQQIPWSAAHEKLLTAFVGDAMPDVFQVGNTWIPELAALGALAPLDARLAASATARAADYFPGILDTNVIDGATYGAALVRRHAAALLPQRPPRRRPAVDAAAADWATWLGRDGARQGSTPAPATTPSCCR